MTEQIIINQDNSLTCTVYVGQEVYYYQDELPFKGTINGITISNITGYTVDDIKLNSWVTFDGNEKPRPLMYVFHTWDDFKKFSDGYFEANKPV